MGSEVKVSVTNTGKVAGAESVQAYVHDLQSRLVRPEKELAAFEKVFLEPGETKHLTLVLDKYSVGYYDTSFNAWIAEEGEFKVLVGASSADIRYVLLFQLFLSG
jgi:beta-glucosidase